MHQIRSRAALAVVVAAVALAVPAGAEAATFTVNSTADTVDANPGNGVCATSGSVCTLRAAVGEANLLAGADTIGFGPAFDGSTPASLISLSSTLEITTPIEILGGNCGTVSLPEPCAEVRASQPIRDFTITADDVTVQGLSLTSASGIGIDVTDGQGTVITGNWFGRALDLSTPGNSTGVQIGTAASDAQIGGTTTAERNVFEGGVEGIQIRGDNNVVEGNTFGLKPDLTQGLGSIYAVRIGIAVNDPDPTSGNMVGGTDTAATPEDCDGACNLFANAGSQIVLNDSIFNEVDDTTIRGNFFGYGIDGTPVSSANGASIDNQSADGTTVGGPATADANYIGGAGVSGVEAFGDAQSLSIANNFFGLTPSGDAAHPNGQADVRLSGFGPTTVDDNRFASNGIEPTASAIDVQAQGGNTTILGNVIGEGTLGEDLGYGVPAIRLAGDQNIVGSDTVADYNTIENGDTSAIEVSGDDNELRTNLGDNDGQFIDLIPNTGPGNDPANGANAGIQAPVITSATTTSAQGTRDNSTFSTVRVYRLSQQGVVEYLGQDPGFGATWSVSFPAVTAGDCIAATQTLFGGPGSTSELSGQVAAASGSCDATPPGTTIDAGPTQGSDTPDTTPTFEFSSASDPAATFQCRYENEAWRACSGAGTDTPAAPLSFGQHTFSVRAVDAAGNPDPTPAQIDFEVTAPPHATSVSLSCTPATVATGGDSSCDATVTDTDGSPTQPQGQVQFSTGATGSFTPASCTLAGASASTSSCEVDYTPGAAGSHTISATYAGSAAHDGSGPATDDVTATSVHATDATLVCAPASVLVGNATSCEATIEDPTGTPSAPQGQVQLTTNRSGSFAPAGSCTLAGASADSSSCEVTYTPTALGGGTHQLTATYAGNATHAGSNDGFALAVTTGGPGPDTTAPDTTITDSPKKKLKRKKGKRKAKATFEFTSTENGSTFECQIDKKPAAACTSPKTFKLKKGKHKFLVTATDSSGNADQTPATFKFKVR